MKRDFDVIRNILLKAEKLEGRQMLCIIDRTEDEPSWEQRLGIATQSASALEDDNTVFDPLMFYNALKLREGGYIETDSASSDEICIFSDGITWSGHDLLDSIRDDKVWKGTMEKVASVGGSVTLDILKSIAEGVMRSYLGL